jgi:hypothetical protein
MKWFILIVISLVLTSCNNKEKIGIIISLKNAQGEISYGESIVSGSAEINWREDGNLQSANVSIAEKSKQIIVPEGSIMSAYVSLLVIDTKTQSMRAIKVTKSFTAVKNNPNWDLP